MSAPAEVFCFPDSLLRGRAALTGDFTTAVIWYEYHCTACNTIERVRFVIPRDGEVPRPTVPDGWMQVEGVFYCPRHEVTHILFVDGKRV